MITRVLRVIAIATTFFLFAMLSLWGRHPVSRAQSGDIVVSKVLNKESNVVRVGEVLSFTIALTNESAFTLTGVTLIDIYDNSTLAFSGARPAHDAHNAGRATITWTNVATPPIPPGQTISVTVTFTAEHPKPVVVNFARAQDIIHEMGAISFTAEASQTQESIGGSAPVFKSLWPTGTIAVAGFPLTFTHRITNDGAALLTYLPLTDTYDTNFLEYNFAIPTPTVISPPGLLVWTNLASPTYFGPISPFQTIVVTTVFTATTDVVTTVNEASTQGARDEYDNDLTADQAQVPIIILPAPTNTPTPEATPAPANTPVPRPTKTPGSEAPAPAPLPTATPTVTPTVLPFPTILPETGQPYDAGLWVVIAGFFALAIGRIIFVRRSR